MLHSLHHKNVLYFFKWQVLFKQNFTCCNVLCLLPFSISAAVEAKGESDCLSEEDLSAIVNKSELQKITDKHRPRDSWAFWYPESEMDKTELETGQYVRLKTKGNSPFICESYLTVLYF